MFEKILVASDGSEHAIRAAELAAELARSFGSRITIVNIATLPAPVTPLVGVTGMDIDAVTVAEYNDRVQDAVAQRTGKVFEQAGIPFDVRLEVGHPAGEIARIAEEEQFDLIVIGSRGHSGFKSFLLGSVSDQVMHHAHCPVLVVK